MALLKKQLEPKLNKIKYREYYFVHQGANSVIKCRIDLKLGKNASPDLVEKGRTVLTQKFCGRTEKNLRFSTKPER
jgi:hypothetical protein